MDIDLKLTIFLILIICPYSILSCPRMQCAPIISKCQLIDACRCQTELDYSCHKNCSHCLGDLFEECCSCVGVCPTSNSTEKINESHVKVFEVTNNELFDLFVRDGDEADRWHVHTQAANNVNSSTATNCSMAFLSSCVDMYKCEASCVSMGASAFRWFHIGCCECIGKYCPNYGANDIRCRDCPYESDRVIDSGEIP